MHVLSEENFIKILKLGIARTSSFMAQLTDFHGGPTKTEYVLTSDIARAFLETHQEVRLEYQNRFLINVMTKLKGCPNGGNLGSIRTDVVVLNSRIFPKAMIEVKIGVGGTLSKVSNDLVKMAKTINLMKSNIAQGVRTAAVFQTHIAGRSGDIDTNKLKARMQKRERKLEKALANFERNWPDFSFKLVSLQGLNTGFVATEICEEEDGSMSLGQKGHATRYYAILLTSLRTAPVGRSFRERFQGD
jgi:hypothetical protein